MIKKIMDMKIVEVIINSIFGWLIYHTFLVIYIILFEHLIVENDFIMGIIGFNIILIGLDVMYNVSRYKKRGNNLFFWLSIILPIILIGTVLTSVIILFF